MSYDILHLYTKIPFSTQFNGDFFFYHFCCFFLCVPLLNTELTLSRIMLLSICARVIACGYYLTVLLQQYVESGEKEKKKHVRIEQENLKRKFAPAPAPVEPFNSKIYVVGCNKFRLFVNVSHLVRCYCT